MHLPRTYPRLSGLAASGILVVGGVAARSAVGRRRRLRRDGPAAGEVLQRWMLGSEARYRVLGTAPRTVDVEVLRAPGLRPGTQLRLDADTARSARRPRA